MPVNDTRASFDTFIAEPFPDAAHGDRTKLHVSAGSGQRRYGFVWWSGMAPRPSIVSQATLRLWLRGSTWTGGPHTITARSVTATWSESKLTWDRSGVGQMGSTVNAASTAVTGGVDGQLVEIDVTAMIADIATGEPWHGIRLEVGTADAAIRAFHSSESDPAFRPQLEIHWNRSPAGPTDQSPASGSVSVSHPVLSWRFRDAEGDQQAQYQVQISTSTSFAVPEFDTGWTVSNSSRLDLSTTAYAGLLDGAVRYWRVRAQDVAGLISPWSSTVQFSRDTKGVLALTNPPNGGVVDETTPPFVTTLTGRTQEIINYNLWEYDGSTVRLLWNSGYHAAPAASGVEVVGSPPKGLIRRTDRTYIAEALSIDTVDREATPGDPVFSYARSDFTFVRSATPLPVTSLTAVEDGPGVKLTWSRDTLVGQPDYWALVVNGVRVYDRLNPLDFDIGNEQYALRYYGAQPNWPNEFEVEAVVLDGGTLKHSQNNATVVYNALVSSVWLVDSTDAPFAVGDAPWQVEVRTDDPPDLVFGESASMFYPVGRRSPVRITDAIRGREGTVSGQVLDNHVNGVHFMKHPANTQRVWRLLFGDISVPVQVGEVSDTHSAWDQRMHDVSIEVFQIAEFPGGGS